MKEPLRNYNVRKLEQYKAQREENVLELIELKKIQDFWDCEENNESIAS